MPARTPAQDAAEAEKNRNWDPNSALAGKNPAPGPRRPASAPATVPPPRVGGRAADRRRRRCIDPVPPHADATGRAARGRERARPRRRPRRCVPSQPARDDRRHRRGAFTYFVQAGAYSRSEDAEQQRAKLAMIGVESRLTEREQGGRTVYRVRVGPFDRREDAERAKEKLGDSASTRRWSRSRSSAMPSAIDACDRRDFSLPP